MAAFCRKRTLFWKKQNSFMNFFIKTEKQKIVKLNNLIKEYPKIAEEEAENLEGKITVEEATCVRACLRWCVYRYVCACVRARVRACVCVRSGGGGYVRACACAHVTFFLSFCHAESVQPRNSS